MQEKNIHNSTRLTLLGLIVLLLVGSLGSAGAAGLSDRESDGYLQWLHSLEMAHEGRLKAGLEEGNLLYPFDIPGWIGDESRPYRHLSISKAINELERQWQLRGSNRADSPLVALANARNYVNLSEFDSAMVWFDKASVLDTDGNFQREISREKLASAAAHRDSVAMLACITNTIGKSEITGHENEFILALRWLLIHRDSETVDLVLEKIQADHNNLSDRLRFWVAYSLSWRKERGASLDHLRILINNGGLSRDLTESQRAWVLVAIPDFLFLDGDQDSSRLLYEVLGNSKLPELHTWGIYQVANLDFLSGRYLRASEGFKRICDTERLGTYQDQACEMATVASEIERIKSEGEPYGAGSFYNP